jgi:hypothetical protein
MKKILLFSIFGIFIIVGIVFTYYNNPNLFTKKKNCSAEFSSEIGSDKESMSYDVWSVAEFTTKGTSYSVSESSLRKSIIGVTGIKDVRFGETCSGSRNTNVKIYYSPKKTDLATIQASFDEIGIECSGFKECEQYRKTNCGSNKK